MVEVKVCLGSRVIVTAGESGRPSGTALSFLLPDGPKLIREGPSSLLVALAERVSDSYVSAVVQLQMDDQARVSRRGDRGGRARVRSALPLLRWYLRAHRYAIEKLRSHGRRWLDCEQLDRLSALATRLGGVAVDSRAVRGRRERGHVAGGP
jgi:hypothetical protein